jgi:hypothetical protein
MYECLDDDRERLNDPLNRRHVLNSDALAALSAEHTPDMLLLMNDPSGLSPPITTYPVSQRSAHNAHRHISVGASSLKKPLIVPKINL